MSHKEKLRQAFKAIRDANRSEIATFAVCKSVSGQSCTITIDDLDIEDINLGDLKSSNVIYPKQGTDVLVIFNDGSATTGFVVWAREVDKVEVMGNVNGGMALTQVIAQRLSRLENAFAAFQTTYNAHTHVETGGTTGAPLLNQSNQVVTPATVQSDISSQKVFHGNG